jgi:hypothetical protein
LPVMKITVSACGWSYWQVIFRREGNEWHEANLSLLDTIISTSQPPADRTTFVEPERSCTQGVILRSARRVDQTSLRSRKGRVTWQTTSQIVIMQGISPKWGEEVRQNTINQDNQF